MAKSIPGFPLLNKAPEPAGSARRADREGSDVLAAFAQDTTPAAEAVRALLDDPTPEKAKALMDRLPDLLPEDPALASVIAEEMAKEFGTVAANKEEIVFTNTGTSEGARKGWETRRKNGWSKEQVDANKKAVRDLADEALDHRDSNRTEHLGVADGQEAEDIKQAIGIDVTGFQHDISSNDIRHADVRHGSPRLIGKKKIGERQKSQIPLDREDFERIPELYSDYDRIEKGNPENKTGLPAVRYVKEYPDGMLYAVEVVVEKDKVMRYKTGWKKKIKNDSDVSTGCTSPLAITS